ncbi:hypothetical protein [Halostagnicola sp. A-GB9-2]|uniref:hypothetical protein n=1 Tax=Halostagnicola sp. A-GB9-2 TaxID=3048066 RepID=UPI0024BF5A19|nr:hypothetical protein [Halostagnicola sp. A-GB9-2]MDJ1434570.1 hypothetical protein [Halostagnicola sp. A-GB9-2]
MLTGDDVERDDDWLAMIKRHGEKHGTVTAVPVFYSEDYPVKLLEAALYRRRLARRRSDELGDLGRRCHLRSTRDRLRGLYR